MNDIKSLSHSKWRCKYHIVFAPKYRRQVIYKKIRVDIGKILRQLCERKKVEIMLDYSAHLLRCNHKRKTLIGLSKPPV